MIDPHKLPTISKLTNISREKYILIVFENVLFTRLNISTISISSNM